jgi:hypothetical protein
VIPGRDSLTCHLIPESLDVGYILDILLGDDGLNALDCLRRCAFGSSTVSSKDLSNRIRTKIEEYTPDEDGQRNSVAGKTRWQAYIGNFLALNKDEDGDIPTVGQFPQMSMEPHITYMRSLASQFAGETGIPVSYLGIIHDNPASAEAMYAASEELIIQAHKLNRSNSKALCNVAMMAMAILEDVPLSKLTNEQKSIKPKFKNPAQTSIVSCADAAVKQVSAVPWIGETRVILESMGYTEEQIVRMMSDKRKAEGNRIFDEAAARYGTQNGSV